MIMCNKTVCQGYTPHKYTHTHIPSNHSFYGQASFNYLGVDSLTTAFPSTGFKERVHENENAGIIYSPSVLSWTVKEDGDLF